MKRIDERGKTRRAYAAYEDLLDAADTLSQKMSRQLRTWNLTIIQYRVLETIYREGGQYQEELSRRFKRPKQNVASVIRTLQECGLVKREDANLPPAPPEGQENSNGGSAKRRYEHGRRIMKLRLTPQGEELFAHVFPRHAKVVKAELRCLHGQEQETLSRICRKLMEGDILKFFKEIRMEEAEDGGRRRKLPL